MLTKEILEWPRTKYFYHELEDLSVNYCLGYSHQLHSIACAMAEAAHLNRTLLLADKFCSSHFHNPTGDAVWHPFDNVFNISLLRKHVRIELLPDPSAFIETLTPGSSVVYLRNEILTEVCQDGAEVHPQEIHPHICSAPGQDARHGRACAHASTVEARPTGMSLSYYLKSFHGSHRVNRG